MLRLASIFGLAACSGLAACGGSSSETTPDSGVSACHGTHFDSTVTSWTLPPGTFDRLADSNPNGRNHATLDLDGDGKLDLVVMRTSFAGSDGVGTKHWLVYRGGDAGFGAAQMWTLPTAAGGFDQLADNNSNGRNHALVDLDGDHRLDLVVTRSSYDTSDGVGRTQWRVYANTGSGFAAAPTAWTIPPMAGGIPQLADSDSQGRVYTTTDLDGDGRPDLVISAAGYGFPGEVGATHWNVYANTGTGFSTTATSWALPQSMAGFRSLADSDNNGRIYTTTDLDADGRPDLVISAAGYGFPGEIGATHWNVYANTGTGFASAATSWTLPQSMAGFRQLADSDSSGRDYALTDLDGDRRPELVLTQTSYSSADQVGRTHWKTYANTGTGFASAATDWPLPQGAGSFALLGDADSQNRAYATLDLDGDHRGDIVMTSTSYSYSDGVGKTHWAAYRNLCD
jgi:hypothetical protein